MTMPARLFADHFSGAAGAYAAARPEYPPALFDWIAQVVPVRTLAWEAGCGSGQASRGLARVFGEVFATDPSAAQIAQAHGPDHVRFAVEPGERCSLGDASADAVCVAQALHWFDRTAFFDECARVLRPGGVLLAWGYQDVVVPASLAAPVAAFQAEVAPYWPPERALVDDAYAGFEWPFAAVATPVIALAAEWPLARLLAYFASYSATRRHREATGFDAVDHHAAAITAAWGDPDTRHAIAWPFFLHARRAP